MLRFMTRAGGVAAALLLLPMQANAVPANGNYLTGLGSSSVQLVSDGTSNTILFSEATRFAVCFDDVGFDHPGAITDGTSNTVLFGAGASLTFQAGRVLPRQPITTIADGTSNTILLGETRSASLCFGGDTRLVEPVITDGSSNTILLGEDSRFDVCFRSARIATITDGSSNTILLGEPSASPICYQDVSVAADLTVATSEPMTLASLGVGLVGLWRLRRR